MAHTELGSIAWTQRTSGHLSSSEKRSLVAPLVRAHARNTLGRISMILRLNAGRNVFVPLERLAASDSSLTQEAEAWARRMLPSPLLNHGFRAFLFGRALGALEQIDVDDELLFAAAMLHAVGLVNPTGDADFTLTSARVARDLAERVGLSTAASTTMQTAITMHHTPGVTAAAGAVPYLLSAGAAVDVVGLRAGELPPSLLAEVLERHPRVDFKKAFATAIATESARVPCGRVHFLRRYGAYDAAIRWAPFDS